MMGSCVDLNLRYRGEVGHDKVTDTSANPSRHVPTLFVPVQRSCTCMSYLTWYAWRVRG